MSTTNGDRATDEIRGALTRLRTRLGDSNAPEVRALEDAIEAISSAIDASPETAATLEEMEAMVRFTINHFSALLEISQGGSRATNGLLAAEGVLKRLREEGEAWLVSVRVHGEQLRHDDDVLVDAAVRLVRSLGVTSPP